MKNELENKIAALDAVIKTQTGVDMTKAYEKRKHRDNALRSVFDGLETNVVVNNTGVITFVKPMLRVH